jgi:hypothetical protein
VNNEMMATGIMEMDALIHELLKLDGLDQEEVHPQLTLVLYHEGMEKLQHLRMSSQFAMI